MAGEMGRPAVAVRFEAPLGDLLARNQARERQVPPGGLVAMTRDMAVTGSREELRADGCDLVLDAPDVEAALPRHGGQCSAG